MEAFWIIGMVFGMSALWIVLNLKKEVEHLKKTLNESGVLKEKKETINK